MRIMYDPGASVTHRLSATSGGTPDEKVRRLAERNALLCLVRNAPASVARRFVVDRMRLGWSDPIARMTARKLPWALASRARLARRWTCGPDDVWHRWVDQDAHWDQSPAGTDAR
jgi:hypothetical protein